MERVFDIVGTIPPNTKAWLGLLCCLSLATTNHLVAPAKLVFLPGKIFREPWRVFTLFFYLGDFLIFLLQGLFSISRCLASFESNYCLQHDILPRPLTRRLTPLMKERLDRSMRDNRTIDHTYFMLSVGLSIVAVVQAIETHSSVQFFILGPILQTVIHYINSRLYPDENFMYLGIQMPARYSPALLAGLQVLLDRNYHQTFRDIVHNRTLSSLWPFLVSREVLEIVVGLAIGHTWWFVRFFLMTEVYAGWLDVFDESVDGAWPNDLVRVALQFLLTPPWYFYTIHRLLQEEDGDQEPLHIAVRPHSSEHVQSNGDVQSSEHAQSNEHVQSNAQEISQFSEAHAASQRVDETPPVALRGSDADDEQHSREAFDDISATGVPSSLRHREPGSHSAPAPRD